MVGLVVVSHSRDLAEAVLELARQAGNQSVPIASAGGVGADRSEFGTDAVQISEAISSVFSEDGVLVLMDLGSAVLSSEMALELLDPQLADKVRFCSAPLVEGAISACVQAGFGSDLDTVSREARGALLAKQEQLGDEPIAATATDLHAEAAKTEERWPAAGTGSREEAELQITTEHGLHARPAALFVRTVGEFDAEVRISNATRSRGPVDASSVNRVATLGVRRDDVVRVEAYGADAERVVAALRKLAETCFGEPAAPAADEVPGAQEKPARAKGPAGRESVPGGVPAVTLSEGVALGPLYRPQPVTPEAPSEAASDPGAELAQLNNAIALVRREINERMRRMQAQTSAYEASIFDAHLLILEDPDVLQRVREGVQCSGYTAAYAWQAAIAETAALYRGLDDEYMRQRADDVKDVGHQVLMRLLGESAVAHLSVPPGSVLVVEELTPTETASLDMNSVAGILTVTGGPASHAAIIARSLGIPALAGVRCELLRLPRETLVGFDGYRGVYWIDPPEDVRQDLTARREAWLSEREQLRAAGQADAVTADGVRIEVAANIGSVEDARTALPNGAEAIGLLRTEFLFLESTEAPNEEQQLRKLRQIGKLLGDRPIVVRTLDIGGDKQIPYLELPREANPFLGVRAIRLSFQHPELFTTQLRAILRAAADANYRVMFPMIADLEDFSSGQRMLEQAHEELDREGIPHRWPIETGMMVETPAAVMQSEVLAREVDFFSIGTNDLTQYSMAAERGNQALARFADPLHPAVLGMIVMVVAAAARHDRYVSVCGELAGDEEALPILVGLGVDELSLNAAGIPRIKSLLLRVDSGEARRLAQEALACTSAGDVRRLSREYLGSLK